MKLLCTGDLHLGRRPSRVPQDIGRRASAAVAWATVVEEACARGVDAVVLTGDVVDRDNRFFEAFGPLEHGVRRLVERGIEVLAVAGNHDYDVLPRLADTLGEAGFHLLGRDGRWERVTLERDGTPWLHVDGWSFPREHVRADPLADYPATPQGQVPVIGLLHTDTDQAGSPYAPTRIVDLRRQPVTAWLIGHVHAPRLVTDGAGAAVLNPGSPQALDPGEHGDHCAWLVAVDGPGRFQATPLPVARVRYDLVEIDLAGAGDRAEVEQRVVDHVTDVLQRVAVDSGPLEHVRLRLHLAGRTAVHGALGSWLAELADLAPGHGTVQSSVEIVRDHTRPAVDLADLARGHDPVGHLAALLLALEQPDPPPEIAELLTRTRRTLAQVDRARPYAALRGGADGDDAEGSDALAREILAIQGHRLLDRLLEQRGEAS